MLPILAFVFHLTFDPGLIARALWANPLQIAGEWIQFVEVGAKGNYPGIERYKFAPFSK